MGQDVPPIPHMTAITDQFGRLTPTWADWFKKAAARMGGNNSLSNAELATRQIGTALIQDAAITTAKLADGSVTTAKILDANVTPSKLVDGSIGFTKLIASQWPALLSTNGYQKLPTGLAIQWGRTGVLSSGSTTTVSFPATFPTACLQVYLGLYAMSASAATGPYGTGAYTTSTFEINNNTSDNLTFNWFAVGY